MGVAISKLRPVVVGKISWQKWQKGRHSPALPTNPAVGSLSCGIVHVCRFKSPRFGSFFICKVIHQAREWAGTKATPGKWQPEEEREGEQPWGLEPGKWHTVLHGTSVVQALPGQSAALLYSSGSQPRGPTTLP